MTPDSVTELWSSYHASPTRDARDRLILHYSPLVKYVAGRVAVGLPQNVEQSDLVSYGIFGLIDAIEKFDLAAGVKFATFATYRIRGAITDEMRGPRFRVTINDHCRTCAARTSCPLPEM